MAEPQAKRRRLDNVEGEDEATQPSSINGLSFMETHVSDHARVIQGNVYQSGNVEYHVHIPTMQPLICTETEGRQRLLYSLKFDDMGQRARNTRTASPKTCDWFFETGQYQAWLGCESNKPDRSILCIKGKPGIGKSTIMKTALVRLKKMYPERIVNAYFFDARSREGLNKSSLGFYQSLMFQILGARPEKCSSFWETFRTKLNLEGYVDPWSTNELRTYLEEHIMHDTSIRLTILVDAVDEGEIGDARRLVADIQDLALRADAKRSDLRICLSGRSSFAISIKKKICAELDINDQPYHKQDIKVYVDDYLCRDESLEMLNISREICSKSRGIFLWVVIVVQKLNEVQGQGCSITKMRDCLDRMPEGLSDLFASILGGAAMDRDCLALLQWGLFSLRPLRPVEMYLAVQFSQAPLRQAIEETATLKHCSDYIVHHSRGLMELTRSNPPVVQFIHESVREYLLDCDEMRILDLSISTGIQGPSNEKLKDTCMRYIEYFLHSNTNWSTAASHQTQSDTVQATYKEAVAAIQKAAPPLLAYATDNLLMHAEIAQECGIQQYIFLKFLLSWDDRFFRLLYQLQRALTESGDRYAVPFKLMDAFSLNYLVEYDLFHLAQVVLGNQLVDPSTECSSAGKRTNIDISGPRFQNGQIAAWKAMRRGSERFLRLLCQSLSPTAINWGDVLCRAVREDQRSMLYVMLSNGIDPNAQGYNSCTAINYACEQSHTMAVSMLLQYGAYPNVVMFGNGEEATYSPLEVASAHGQLNTVKLLLQAGADPGLNGTIYGGPLLAAMTALDRGPHLGGYQLIIYLLDYCADAFTVPRKASFWGPGDISPLDVILKILLSNFDRTARFIWTGVHWHLYARCVEVLLDSRAYITEDNFWQIMKADDYCLRFDVVQRMDEAFDHKTNTMDADTESLTVSELERMFPDVDLDTESIRSSDDEDYTIVDAESILAGLSGIDFGAQYPEDG